MGNEDGIAEALSSMGSNKVIHFDNGYFSFALGNEIALVIKGKYYILNCDETIWKKVEQKVKELNKDERQLRKWWKKQSKYLNISTWTNDFDDL